VTGTGGSCWGENGFGQLGTGAPTDARTPVSVPGIASAVELRTGSNFACARFADGTGSCWGNNYNGQLGNGTTNGVLDAVPPGTIMGLAGAEEIAAGWDHACALRVGGTVECWGRNDDGRLGTGDEVRRTEPEAVMPPPPR
jgi:alpha-tubulin suppressor-like RCC1 family protein